MLQTIWILAGRLNIFVLLGAALCFGCGDRASQALDSSSPVSSNNDDINIIWGIGNEIGSAMDTPVYHETPVKMITTWFNKPDDLDWMSYYRSRTTISDLYGKGFAHELVIWLADYPDYAVSQQFQDDLKTLIDLCKGNGPHYGPLYVVLFTEFETYSDDPAYFQKLKDAFLQSKKTINAAYDSAYVAIGFGGYGWSGVKERSFKDWESAMLKASDFAAVQAMHHVSNLDLMIPQVRNSIHQLGSYGKPVMLSHFRIWKREGEPGPTASAAFGQFIDEVFSDRSLKALANDGLFAWDFMGDDYINDPGPGYEEVKDVISTYGSDSVDLSDWQ